MTGNPPPSSAPAAANQIPGPLRVLLVAESAVEQRLAAGLLARHGHQIVAAGNSDEALACWSQDDVDVVLIDFLPGSIEGADIIRPLRLRAESLARRIPIFVMCEDGNGRESALPDGIDGWISKPPRNEQLTSCFARIVANGGSRSEPTAVSTSPSSDVVDWSVTLEAVGGRSDLLNELVEIFFAEYPGALEEIREAIERKDAPAVQLYSHKLKGCLRYFGQSEAVRLAGELERMGRSRQLDAAHSTFDELVVATNRLLPSLKAGPDG